MCLPICGLLWGSNKANYLRFWCVAAAVWMCSCEWLLIVLGKEEAIPWLKVNWPTPNVHCWVTDTKHQLIARWRTMRSVRYFALGDAGNVESFCHAVQFLLSKKNSPTSKISIWWNKQKPNNTKIMQVKVEWIRENITNCNDSFIYVQWIFFLAETHGNSKNWRVEKPVYCS